ncbi:MAG TPA: hypothetical protein VGM92_03495 [Candidatus Kapabacteria bacterium]|jgi:hypothetical protein
MIKCSVHNFPRFIIHHSTFILAASVLWIGRAQAADARAIHPAIAIERDTISREAIRWQLAHDRCMGDTTATLTSAAAELVSNEMEYAVLNQEWHEVPPDSSIRQTAARLPHVTHDSAALACIAEIGDSAFFLEYYVRPALVNPRLYAHYYSDTIIHRAARDSILRIFHRLRPHPELFLSYPLDTISLKRRDSEMMERPLVRQVLSKLGPRKLWPNIIESKYDYSIVMLDTATDSIYRARAIRVPKPPFDSWFRNYVLRSIPIVFLDREFEREMRKKYPSLWWMRSTKEAGVKKQ